MSTADECENDNKNVGPIGPEPFLGPDGPDVGPEPFLFVCPFLDGFARTHFGFIRNLKNSTKLGKRFFLERFLENRGFVFLLRAI